MTCEAELHDWMVSMPCPMLTHKGFWRKKKKYKLKFENRQKQKKDFEFLKSGDTQDFKPTIACDRTRVNCFDYS